MYDSHESSGVCNAPEWIQTSGELELSRQLKRHAVPPVVPGPTDFLRPQAASVFNPSASLLYVLRHGAVCAFSFPLIAPGVHTNLNYHRIKLAIKENDNKCPEALFLSLLVWLHNLSAHQRRRVRAQVSESSTAHNECNKIGCRPKIIATHMRAIIPANIWHRVHIAQWVR